MIKFFKFTSLAIMLFVVAGCKTKQLPMVDTTEYTGELAPLADMVVKVNENRQHEQCVTARMTLSLYSGKRKAKVGGTIKMKRNEVIQMSLVAFGVVEAARIELTPQHLLIVDRMGRRYVKEKYADVPFFAQAGINFYVMQSLFWDELFLPGYDGTKPLETSFIKTMENDHVRMLNTDNPLMNLTFYASMLTGLVRETDIRSNIEGNDARLRWDYLSYGKLGGKEFPTKMEMNIEGAEFPLTATLQLAKLNTNDDWQTRTEVSKKRYTRITMADVFSRILSLTH